MKPARPAFLLSSFLAEIVLALASQAQSHKLAGPFLPDTGGGDVRELRVSPDGTRVAYSADEETYGVIELFIAPVDGSAPRVKLSGAMTEGGDVAARGFLFSPDGAWLVYLADQVTDGVDELFAVPSDGSAAPVKLNATLVAGGNVAGGTGKRAFAISADSGRVVYRADQEVNEHFDLWSAPIDGSAAPVELDGSVFTLVGSDFWLSSQGRVVFPASTIASGTELLSAPVDGSAAPIALTNLVPPSIPLFELSADGSRAAFVSLQSSPSPDQRVWSVPVDGSAGATLLTPSVLNQVQGLRISADGSRVVYRASLVAPTIFELFSVPLDGSGAPVRLHAPFAAGRNVVADQFGITADSARVLFVADVAADELYEPWSAPLDGSSSALKISGTLAPNADVWAVFGAPLVKASERVLFYVGSDLYSAPADGSGTALKLNGSVSSVTSISYALDPAESPQPFGADHSRVVFARLNPCWLVGFGEHWMTELYSVPADASAAPVRLSGTLHACGGAGNWDIAAGHRVPPARHAPPSPLLEPRRGSPDRVVFTSDKDREDMGELYSVPLDGASAAIKLNGPMALNTPQSYVAPLALTPDGSRALFLLRFLGEGQTEDALYSVPTDGSASFVQIQPPLSLLEQIYTYKLSPDGSRIVFDVIFTGPGSHLSLRSAPTDGSAPPVQLGVRGFPSLYEITPDSAHVIMLGNRGELMRVPIDASAPSVQLTPSDFGASRFLVTPDGSTVVFVGGDFFSAIFELYRVPADGSGPMQKLNPPLVANGDVSSSVLLLSPDGTRAVYMADQEVDGRVELYSVPLADGAATKLNGALVAGGDVSANTWSPMISPDGARVVYLADQEVDERFELYSVPIAGGAATKLNGALVPNGDVQTYTSRTHTTVLISPDSQRVVYFADQEVDERVDLYSVPIAGGTAVRMNGDLVAGGDVLLARISPDGTRVVYLADQELDERSELYSRAIDGSGSAHKLNPSLPSGGDVGNFEITTDGRRVVYSADALSDARIELFRVRITGGPSFRLNGALVPGGDVGDFLVSPDAALAVYAGDQETDDMFELFAAPLDGPGPRPRRR